VPDRATRGDQHDDLAPVRAARHQRQAHYDVLIGDAVAVLKDAQVMLRLLPIAVSVDTDAYRGRACVTSEAATDALGVWEGQLTAMLPEPNDRNEARWVCPRPRPRVRLQARRAPLRGKH
jgi:hypothetical protein